MILTKSFVTIIVVLHVETNPICTGLDHFNFYYRILYLIILDFAYSFEKIGKEVWEYRCSNCKRSFTGEDAELSWEFDSIFPLTCLDLASRLQNIETPDIDRNVEKITEHSCYL